jgi:hypothetical protein
MRQEVQNIVCVNQSNQIQSYLAPHQLGVATKRGCEAATHSVRTFINIPENRDNILLKIDFENAFNSIERDSMLIPIKNNFPLIYPFLYQSYRFPSLLLRLVFSKVILVVQCLLVLQFNLWSIIYFRN